MTKPRAPYGVVKTAILTLVCLLCVVEQTDGQSSTKDDPSSLNFSDGSNFSGWGVDSLYHMVQGVRGAATCATSSCHGGPKAGVSSVDAPRGSEYPLWLERDPHAQSWKTISSDASVKILSKLGILRDGKIANAAGYQNCLACHNTDRNVSPDQLAPRIAEGVGCESCHGPAEAWYDRHYQGFESKKNATSKLGLTDSGPLVQRAKLCATCHVGGKDRDMNHDIIAAGHPALYFDMAVYHEAYPKHWRDKDQGQPNFRSQLWLAGKIAMADAELELLESRASKSLPISTWPELSNYQCNSCHAPLGSLPKPVNFSERNLVINGRASVRNWNLAGIEALSTHSASADTDLSDSYKNLRELLQSPNPDSSFVAAKAHHLRIQWNNAFNESGKPTLPTWSSQNQTALGIQLLEESRRSDSWETAAVAYTAVWASHPNVTAGKLERAMKTMRNGLLFPNDMLMPSFPRLESGRTPPTLEEWNDSLQQTVSALMNDDRR